jgi:peptidyl-dipeptidase A
MIRTTASLAVLASLLCSAAPAQQRRAAAPAGPTAAQATAFVADAERQLSAASLPNNQINWVNATNITEDTDALAAASNA